MAKLGRACAKGLQDSASYLGKLSGCVNGLSDASGFNGATFKRIARVPWEKMHVQMRQRVAVNLIIQLHGLGSNRQRRRHFARVAHKRFSLSTAQIVQLNRVRL